MKELRVLHIIETIGVGGGAEKLVSDTIKNLSDYNNVVITLYPYYVEYDLGSVPVYCLNIRSFFGFLRSITTVRKIIRNHNIELMHAHLFRSVLLARLAKPRSVRLLVSIHSLLSTDLFKSKRALFLERMLAGRQDGLIAVSQTILKDYLNYIKFKKKAFVLHNFIPDTFFTNKENNLKTNSLLKCVAVGKVKPGKNYDYLIESFCGLDQNAIQLDIYGEGPLQTNMLEIIKSNNLKHVFFKGLSDSMDEILDDYQIYISVSQYEGFGIALMEAMAKGLVCITSDIPVYREVGSDACLFIDIINSDALRQLLHKIINNEIDVTGYPAKARARAFEISNQTDYLQRLKNIYKEFIS
jgi:glycosyltransferase involved in cell wall biosynthesis